MKSKIKKYTKDIIQSACRSLDNGESIIIPTDTVYGIAANATNEAAVNNIFKIKKRPRSMPLIIFVRSISEAEKIAEFSILDRFLAYQFWPGPVTLILKKKKYKIYNGDKRLSKIGIRIPRNEVVSEILKKIKKPLATTSANLHKEKNIKEISKLNILLDDKIPLGIYSKEKMSFEESTLIQTSSKKVEILRKGQIKINEIKKLLKKNGFTQKLS